MKLKNKNVLVVGTSKSGQASVNLLKNLKANIWVFDDDIFKLNEFCKINLVQGFTLQKEEDVKKFHLVVLSPGVSIYHELIKTCYLHNIKVISELELGSYFINGKIIAVTGSNGKTTTVSLLDEIFSVANKRHNVAGNIGNPLTNFANIIKTTNVVEVSSFQLESSEIKPNISAILNITPNHLDRHFSFNEYKETKFKIFKNQTKKDVLILNADDDLLNKINEREILAKVLWFSTRKKVEGVFVENNKVFYNKNNKLKLICNIEDIKIKGEHNLSNSLCAVLIALLCKIKIKHIQTALKRFSGVKHRIQFIKEIKGIEFINDSKSTTPSSTITAVNTFIKPIILILGGSDKGIDYSDMIKKLKGKIKLAVLTGDICFKLKKNFDENFMFNYILEKDFFNALSIAYEKAESGDVVLLSPATASYDYFKNFEERGKSFIEFVEGLDD